MKTQTLSTLAFGAWALACRAEAPASPEVAPSAVAAPAAASGPQEALAALDPRTPVPLQPMMAWHQKQNMMAHLETIQQITAALAAGDFEAAAKASRAIEASPQMQAMCQHMGAGAEGFTPRALDFHERAHRIGVAARAKDMQASLRATANTLEACTGCHRQYRQEVVDAATWQALTGSHHDPAAMAHPGAH